MAIYAVWRIFFLGKQRYWVDAIFYFGYPVALEKAQKENNGPEKVGIGLFSLILLAQLTLLIVLHNVSVTTVAQTYLKSEQSVLQKVGAIQGFWIIPQGSVTSQSSGTASKGDAEIQMVVKGEKRCVDVAVRLQKNADAGWQVVDFKFD
jgi:hypothetical protein